MDTGPVRVGCGNALTVTIKDAGEVAVHPEEFV
jgi:hypothetical protein